MSWKKLNAIDNGLTERLGSSIKRAIEICEKMAEAVTEEKDTRCTDCKDIRFVLTSTGMAKRCERCRAEAAREVRTPEAEASFDYDFFKEDNR